MLKVLQPNDYTDTWEYTHDWCIPLKPKHGLKCPICGSSVRFKEYYPHCRYYKVTGPKYRIDVWYKCNKCAFVWTHGVSVSKEYYDEITGMLQEKIGRVRPLHILESIDIVKGQKNGG